MCFGCSKEPSHGDGSLGTHNICFLLRNKKNNVQLHTLSLNNILLKYSTFMQYIHCQWMYTGFDSKLKAYMKVISCFRYNLYNMCE